MATVCFIETFENPLHSMRQSPANRNHVALRAETQGWILIVRGQASQEIQERPQCTLGSSITSKFETAAVLWFPHDSNYPLLTDRPTIDSSNVSGGWGFRTSGRKCGNGKSEEWYWRRFVRKKSSDISDEHKTSIFVFTLVSAIKEEALTN
jgi:hypothetical protein